MKTHLLTLGLALFLIATGIGSVDAAVSPGDETELAHDTWYHDLESHWARPYLLTLWEEGVTDGYPVPIWGSGTSWEYGFKFRPDWEMPRGKLLFMMSKIFQLPPDDRVPSDWPDLNPWYQLYGQPAYPLINAAATSWNLAPPGESLALSNTVTRTDAVHFILSSLLLTDHAKTLSDATIDDLLAPFEDACEIPTEQRSIIAASIQLGLLIGYPDQTLRVNQSLSRAEGATILYRSCLMRLLPAYSTFHPDNDAYRELLPIDIIGLRNANHRRWHVHVTTMDGDIVRFLPTLQPKLGNPEPVVWDGTSDEGEPVACDQYLIGGYIEDRRGTVFDAVSVPIQLVRRDLRVEGSPSVIFLGETFKITARTRGGAHKVELDLPSGATVDLHYMGQQNGESVWQHQIQTSAAKGFEANTLKALSVTARFTGSDRHDVVKVEILETDDEPDLTPHDGLITTLTR